MLCAGTVPTKFGTKGQEPKPRSGGTWADLGQWPPPKTISTTTQVPAALTVDEGPQVRGQVLLAGKQRIYLLLLLLPVVLHLGANPCRRKRCSGLREGTLHGSGANHHTFSQQLGKLGSLLAHLLLLICC